MILEYIRIHFVEMNNKEKKIKKVIPLIEKYFGCSNEYDGEYICKTINNIASLLKVNQWLRIEDKPYDIENNIDVKQVVFLKPNTHLWYSKGEWIFGDLCCRPNKYLSLIEIDYSKILILTTKKDYLDFEKKYCIYKSFTKKSLYQYGGFQMRLNSHYPKAIKNFPKNKNKIQTHKQIQLNNKVNGKKNGKKNNNMICKYDIKWHNVAIDYDGIAIVPNPTPYFTKDKMEKIDFDSHIWLKTFDVSSLAIWRQNNKSPITKSITIGKLEDIASKSDIKNRTSKYCDILIDEIKKSQIKLLTQ